MPTKAWNRLAHCRGCSRWWASRESLLYCCTELRHARAVQELFDVGNPQFTVRIAANINNLRNLGLERLIKRRRGCLQALIEV